MIKGIKITQSQGRMKIDQTTHANDAVKRFERYLTVNLDTKYSTPMEWEFKITKSDFNEMTEGEQAYAEKFPYQNVIGALLYLAINTRSDVSYPMGVLAKHCV